MLEFKIQNSKLNNKNVISHFCKNEGQRSENLLCKNVEIYLIRSNIAKKDFEAKNCSMESLK